MTTETLAMSQFLEWMISLEEDGRARSLRDLAEAMRSRGDELVAEFLEQEAARVLATCKAHRAIVEAHPLVSASDVWGTEVDGWACEVCDLEPDLTLGGIEFTRSDGCKTLRALASIYADDPAFDPRWAL